MAKIAISSQGQTMDSQVDARFGRASFFLVVGEDGGEPVVLDNSQAQGQGHGAGIQAAQLVASSGAGVVLTGVVGPKAWNALEAAGVEIVQGAGGAVSQALEDYRAGKLQPASAAEGTPHQGMGGGGRGMGGGGRGGAR